MGEGGAVWIMTFLGLGTELQPPVAIDAGKRMRAPKAGMLFEVEGKTGTSTKCSVFPVLAFQFFMIG